jgi:hypothetical protein
VSDSGVALSVSHGKEHWLLSGDVVHAVMLRNMAAYGTAVAAAAAKDDYGGVALPGRGAVEVQGAQLRRHPGLRVPYPHVPGAARQVPSAAAAACEFAGREYHWQRMRRFFNKEPSASLVPCTIFTAHDHRVLYAAATAGGDSGGALVLHGKVLAAMHVEGLNDLDGDGPAGGKGGKGSMPKRMRLSAASLSTTGAALRLDLCEVQEAIATADQNTAGVGRRCGRGRRGVNNSAA